MDKYTSKLGGNGENERSAQMKMGKPGMEPSSSAKSKMDYYSEELSQGVSDLYKEGKKKINEAQQTLKEYGDDLAQNVQSNPIKAILIAGGIGFILSMLFRK